MSKWAKEVLDALRRGDGVAQEIEHRLLCHSDGTECSDGCDRKATPKMLVAYKECEGPNGYKPGDQPIMEAAQ